jgi:hypothetical protein
VRSGSQGCPTRERSSRVFPPPTQDAFPLRGGLGQHVQTGATPLPPLRGGPGRGARSARGVDPDATSALMQRSSARRSRLDRRWRAVPHPSPPLRGGNAWCVFRRGFPPEPTRRSGARPHPPGAAGCPQTLLPRTLSSADCTCSGPRDATPSPQGRAGAGYRAEREGASIRTRRRRSCTDRPRAVPESIGAGAPYPALTLPSGEGTRVACTSAGIGAGAPYPTLALP